MKTLLSSALLALTLFASPSHAQSELKGGALLKFSDGRADLSDLSRINDVLLTVGVRLSRMDVPDEAIPLLEAAMAAPLSDAQKERVLELFALSREDMLDQVRIAGRDPVIEGGGSMTTSEVDVPPYPKVYDLSAMTAEDRLAARNKFARLHVNSTDDMVGVDEVMTLPSGGPWTWYFQVEDDVAVELQMARVEPGEKAWRLSYPGLTPHGAYFHSETGLCIAYITGPETWTMRYQAPIASGAGMLGENPFIDFDAN